MQSFFLAQTPPPHSSDGRTDRKAVQVHGEFPEIAAHPGPVMGSNSSSVTGHSASHLHVDKKVSLGEPLVEAQEQQVASQSLVFLLSEEVRLLLARLIQLQRLSQLCLYAAQLKPTTNPPKTRVSVVPSVVATNTHKKIINKLYTKPLRNHIIMIILFIFLLAILGHMVALHLLQKTPVLCLLLLFTHRR